MFAGINDISREKNNNIIKRIKSEPFKHFGKSFFGIMKQSTDYSLFKNSFKYVGYVFHDIILEGFAKNYGVVNDVTATNDCLRTLDVLIETSVEKV